MTTLRELRKSISDMPAEQLNETLLETRKRRRNSITESAKQKKAKEANKGKKPTKKDKMRAQLKATGFSDEEIERMIG